MIPCCVAAVVLPHPNPLQKTKEPFVSGQGFFFLHRVLSALGL